MKRFVLLGVLALFGSSLFTGCTSVPHDSNVSATTTSSSQTYSK